MGATVVAAAHPHVDWSGNSVLSWSQSCLASCLGAALSRCSLFYVFQVEIADLSRVLAEYQRPLPGLQ